MKMAKELKICTTESLNPSIPKVLQMAKKFGSGGTENMEHGHTTPVTPAMAGRGPHRKQGCEKMLGGALWFKTSLDDGLPEEKCQPLPLQSWRFCHTVLFWFHGVPATVLPKEPLSPAQRAPQPFPYKAASCTRHSGHTKQALQAVGTMSAVLIWQLTYSLFNKKGNSNSCMHSKYIYYMISPYLASILRKRNCILSL